MNNQNNQNVRRELLTLQSEKERNVAKAQKIVLKHLESAIQSEDSATVAAMAEILKI